MLRRLSCDSQPVNTKIEKSLQENLHGRVENNVSELARKNCDDS